MIAMVFSTDLWWINLGLFLGGLWLLTKSSDWFVDAATEIARYFKVSELVIGLTLVSIGTSLPELGANLYASISGSTDVVLGNPVGSNIANLLLILGVGGLLMKEMPISRSIFHRDLLFMGLCFALVGLFSYLISPGIITTWESALLFTLTFGYLYVLKRSHASELEEAAHETEHEPHKLGLAFFILLGAGLAVMLASKLMVDNVVWAAKAFNISELIIASTIVAFGTSLPELAVTVSAAKKGKVDMILGNVIGSCIFNLILVLGLSGLISTLPVTAEATNWLLPVMLLTGFFTLLFTRTGWAFRRTESILFLLGYLSFLGCNLYFIMGG